MFDLLKLSDLLIIFKIQKLPYINKFSHINTLMKQETLVFVNITRQLIRITHKLQALSSKKSQFGKKISFQISRLYQVIKQSLQSREVRIQKFSEVYNISKQQLQGSLFKYNQNKLQTLTPQRLCQYLKINKQNLKKTYSTIEINVDTIQEFTKILLKEIQIIDQVRKLFMNSSLNLQRIFQEIDFFNNKYIDSASVIQFFRHYQPVQIYSEVGCSRLIQLIKGYQYGQEKVFYQDLIDFIQIKQQKQKLEDFSQNQQELLINSNNPSQLQLISLISGESIDKNPAIGHIVKNDSSFFGKTFSHHSRKNSKSNISPQSISPDKSSYQSSLGDSKVDLSISPSVSPKSQRDRKIDFIIQSMNRTNPIQGIKNPSSFRTGDFNSFDSVIQQNKSNNHIKVLHNYEINLRLTQKQKQKQKIVENVFQSINNKRNQFFTTPLINTTFSRQKCFNNDVESNLIKSHSRNQAYLSQVKLMQNTLPKILQSDRKQSNVHYRKLEQNYYRACTSNKLSIFEQKKVQFILLMQLLSQKYFKWYQVIQKLIKDNQKFTFVNAFNVIDTEQNNKVTLRDFKEFLKDCSIQKNYMKIEKFFNNYSVEQKSGSRKDCVKINQLKIQKKLLEQLNKSERNMHFSDFLKMFHLNMAIPLILKAKRRNPQICQKWQQKMRASYCQFFRTVIDTNLQIQTIKVNLKQIYLIMKSIRNEQTFQKTFGRQIMRFDQMQRLIGSNSLALLWEISRIEEYMDQEKLQKFLNLQQQIQNT